MYLNIYFESACLKRGAPLRSLKRKMAEGNSSVVVGWGLGYSTGLWKYVHLIHEIRDLVVSLHIALVHVPRSQSGLAGKTAKWGTELPTVVRSNVMPDFWGSLCAPLYCSFFFPFSLIKRYLSKKMACFSKRV